MGLGASSLLNEVRYSNIRDLKEYIETCFSEELAKHDMIFDINCLMQNGILENRTLGEIPEFGALIQKANEALLPVFALTKKDMGTSGNAYDGMEEKRQRFDRIYETIVQVIMELM